MQFLKVTFTPVIFYLPQINFPQRLVILKGLPSDVNFLFIYFIKGCIWEQNQGLLRDLYFQLPPASVVHCLQSGGVGGNSPFFEPGFVPGKGHVYSTVEYTQGFRSNLVILYLPSYLGLLSPWRGNLKVISAIGNSWIPGNSITDVVRYETPSVTAKKDLKKIPIV